MKKFRFLGILAILVFVIQFALSIGESIKNFREGVNDGYKEDTKYDEADKEEINVPTYRVEVRVSPLDSEMKDSLTNNENISIPYNQSRIRTYISPSLCTKIITGFPILFVVLAMLYGIYLLIRAFISISRKDIFTKKNVWRIRFSCYSIVAFNLFETLQQWTVERDVLAQITLPGYEVLGITPAGISWVNLAFLVILTEIFAVSVKIKEEQDLTI